MNALADESADENDVAGRCQMLVDKYAVALERDGYNEMAFREVEAALEALVTASDDERAAVKAASSRIVELALPHAPPDVVSQLTITWSSLERIERGFEEAPLSSDEVRARCDALLSDLQAGLRAGGLTSPGVLRRTASFCLSPAALARMT